MKLNGLIHTFPQHVKWFIAAFVIVLSIGFFSGLLFVRHADSSHPDGIEENYLGNEDVESVEIMKFRKSKYEMLTTIHTHILSMSFIFFLLGGLVVMTSLSDKLKAFLIIEPFISVILTFGGIYFMWKGVVWMKYVVMISGSLMTAVFTFAAGAVLFQLIKKQ